MKNRVHFPSRMSGTNTSVAFGTSYHLLSLLLSAYQLHSPLLYIDISIGDMATNVSPIAQKRTDYSFLVIVGKKILEDSDYPFLGQTPSHEPIN